MSDFSDLLGKYIRGRGYTNNSFAKQCGIERTLLQKYLSGQRLPHGEEVFENLCDQLRLSPDEKSKLEEAYQQEVLGSELYAQYHLIDDLIERFGMIVKGSDPPFPGFETVKEDISAEAFTLYGRQELVGWIWRCLGTEMQMDGNDIYLIAQPGYKELDSFLQGSAVSSKANLHQLICLNPHSGVESNLALLECVMPLFCSGLSYDLRYYYGNIEEHINSMSVMPNLIITSWCVFLFDYKMTHAIVSVSEAVRKSYLDLFQEMEQKCTQFMNRHDSVLGMIQFYMNHHPCDHSLQYQPCLAYALTPGIVQRILRKEMVGTQEAIPELFKLLGSWGKLAAQQGRFANRNFFTKAGLTNFMKTGRILEFPSVFYDPISPEDRLQMLRTLVEQLRTGLIDAYILKEDRYKIDAGLVIQMTGQEAVHFISNSADGTQTVLELHESSLIRTFSDYLEYIRTSSRTESREETIRWMEEQLEKHEKNLQKERTGSRG